jgi:D-glycero-alpha-D-manno-heptose 1-phosphate guanylyltransferase
LAVRCRDIDVHEAEVAGLPIEEAIVLAGGLGTRLRRTMPDLPNLPKPMLPVAGRPFLEYLLEFLRAGGVRRVVLSVGHLRAPVIEHFGKAWGGLVIDYAVEEAPLGTGGGLQLALTRLSGEHGYVLNGDTLLATPLVALGRSHAVAGRPITLTLRQIADTGRYGRCLVEAGSVTGFTTGIAGEPGLINAGMYAVRRDLFSGAGYSGAFSFENDFMASEVARLRPAAHIVDAPFIDIGIPESYTRAQSFVPALLAAGHLPR